MAEDAHMIIFSRSSLYMYLKYVECTVHTTHKRYII